MKSLTVIPKLHLEAENLQRQTGQTADLFCRWGIGPIIRPSVPIRRFPEDDAGQLRMICHITNAVQNVQRWCEHFVWPLPKSHHLYWCETPVTLMASMVAGWGKWLYFADCFRQRTTWASWAPWAAASATDSESSRSWGPHGPHAPRG